MTLANEYWFGASAGFYPETIDQSLRFNDGDSPYLSRTFGTPTSTTQGTWSCWFKRGDVGSRGMLWSASNYEFIDIQADGQIVVPYLSNLGYVYTNGRFRDPTNWYNLVVTFDTPNATEADRLRIYVNGVRQEVYDSITLSQNATFQRWNVSGYTGHIGNFQYNNTIYYDGLLAECNWIDGTALEPSSFGETKNGVWIPKEISGLTYGNNGFRLTFADSSSLGDDTSGNGNDFTSSGLASTDVVLDSPTNNFAVLNAIEPSGATLSEGNLRFTGKTGVGAGYYATRATFGITSGKWYFEGLATDDDSIVGIGTASASLDNYLGGDAHAYGYAGFNGQKYNNNSGSSYGATFGNGDIIGVAFDADNGTLIFYKNGASQGTAFTSLSATPYFPMVGETAQSSPITTHLNFGQDSSFAGNKTAQGNADENGIGDFYYSPPTGYLALCSSNLPDTTISPNQSTQADDHFITTTYSGDSNNSTQISTGFQPDWVWIKNRTEGTSDGSGEHMLYDSTRGVHDDLNSNNTSAEDTNTNGLQEFGSTFFRPGSLTRTNETGDTYVAWNWKAGGSTPIKTYKVVVVSDSGNKYRFRNSADSATFAQSAVTLDLQEGGTYVFDWSDSSAQGHPIRFSLTSNGTHGGGSEYTTGVVKDDSAYKTTITVASGVATLYYYCQYHSGMGGQINTNTTHGSTNFDGSILSVVQTNETSKFSILTYTGTGSAGTIGHGLGVAPSMVITKVRSTANNWAVYHVGINDNTKALLLDTNEAATAYGGSTSLWNNTAPTSTVFSVGTNGSTGGSGNFVAYVFAEVEGYSKFGSYTGNSSSDGTFIYTGFRPAWIMFRVTNIGGRWNMYDSARDPDNVVAQKIRAELSNAEITNSTDNLDFVSNGVKIRNSGANLNSSSNTYIYMAFAEQPFKFSNSR